MSALLEIWGQTPGSLELSKAAIACSASKRSRLPNDSLSAASLRDRLCERLTARPRHSIPVRFKPPDKANSHASPTGPASGGAGTMFGSAILDVALGL